MRMHGPGYFVKKDGVELMGYYIKRGGFGGYTAQWVSGFTQALQVRHFDLMGQLEDFMSVDSETAKLFRKLKKYIAKL